MSEQIDMSQLSPEMRKRVRAEVKLGRDLDRDKGRAQRLEQQIAKKGERLFFAMQKVQELYRKFIIEGIEARDNIHKYLGIDQLDTRPIGKTFNSEDGLFKAEIIVRCANRLDENKAQQAKGLVEKYIANVTDKGGMDREIKVLVDFLMDAFAKKKRSFTYSSGIHSFLSKHFDDLLLVQAQNLLREAVESAEPYFETRFWVRTNKDGQFTRVPIEFKETADVMSAFLQKRRSERRAKRQADESVREAL